MSAYVCFSERRAWKTCAARRAPLGRAFAAQAQPPPGKAKPPNPARRTGPPSTPPLPAAGTLKRYSTAGDAVLMNEAQAGAASGASPKVFEVAETRKTTQARAPPARAAGGARSVGGVLSRGRVRSGARRRRGAPNGARHQPGLQARPAASSGSPALAQVPPGPRACTGSVTDPALALPAACSNPANPSPPNSSHQTPPPAPGRLGHAQRPQRQRRPRRPGARRRRLGRRRGGRRGPRGLGAGVADAGGARNAAGRLQPWRDCRHGGGGGSGAGGSGAGGQMGGWPGGPFHLASEGQLLMTEVGLGGRNDPLPQRDRTAPPPNPQAATPSGASRPT